jgi:hypothetical protein
MVQASMCVLHVVSMHVWANQYRTTIYNSPLLPHPSYHHLQPCVPCHPKGPNVTTNLDDYNLQDGSIVPMGACLQHWSKEREDIHETSQIQ